MDERKVKEVRRGYGHWVHSRELGGYADTKAEAEDAIADYEDQGYVWVRDERAIEMEIRGRMAKAGRA